MKEAYSTTPRKKREKGKIKLKKRVENAAKRIDFVQSEREGIVKF